MSKYMIYSECIAISEEALSFRVELFDKNKQVAKANLIISRKSWAVDIDWLYFDEEVANSKVSEEVQKHCLARAGTIWGN